MENSKIVVKKRASEGSSNSRRLRHSGSVPAVIYGADKEVMSAQTETHAFEQLLRHNASESIILDVELEGEGEVSLLVKDIQFHPVSGNVLHVDFLRVVKGQMIQVEIPLSFVGDAEGVKLGGLLDQAVHSISVSCLPRDLVDSIEVDISEMGIGDALTIADLNLGDTFVAQMDDSDVIATIMAPKTGGSDDSDADDAATEPEVIGAKTEEA